MLLGVDEDEGYVYEGIASPHRGTWPPPILTAAKLIEQPSDWDIGPGALTSHPHPWVFREDNFDPVTRVRRGRLYQPELTQPTECAVIANPFELNTAYRTTPSGRVIKRLYIFAPCRQILQRANRGCGGVLSLGQSETVSAWRIIQTEVVATEDVLVTLKAMTSFGVVPDLDTARIEERNRQPVAAAVERVLNSAFREAPTSVVDQCKNTIAAVLARWLYQSGEDEKVLTKDLGAVLNILERRAPEKKALYEIADVVRLLHPRGKENEQVARKLRVPDEGDAELAVHALGFVLREIGWAK